MTRLDSVGYPLARPVDLTTYSLADVTIGRVGGVPESDRVGSDGNASVPAGGEK